MKEKKQKNKRHEQKRRNRLYPFNKDTTFWNLLARRKKYYLAYIEWLELMKQKGYLKLDEGYDPCKIKKFTFCFSFHARHGESVVTKSQIYEQLAVLLRMLEGCKGFCRPVEVFYRYISDSAHSNLAVKPNTLKRQILQRF